jgi:cell division protein FtsQ
MSTTRRRAPITRAPAATPAPRRGRLLLAVLAVVVLVAAGVWAVYFSSLLAIDDVQVKGTTTVDAATVKETAAIQLGEPLARLDTDAVVARVGELAPIRTVDVARKWPHTVVVTVTERTPALVVMRGGKAEIYDESGVQFRTVDPGDPAVAGVPLLASSSTPTPTQVTAVLTVVRALPDPVAARLSTVTADSLDTITLLLDGGDVRVVWGSTERGARKAEVLTALMKTPALLYDVSAPDVPTTSGTPDPDES